MPPPFSSLFVWAVWASRPRSACSQPAATGARRPKVLVYLPRLRAARQGVVVVAVDLPDLVAVHLDGDIWGMWVIRPPEEQDGADPTHVPRCVAAYAVVQDLAPPAGWPRLWPGIRSAGRPAQTHTSAAAPSGILHGGIPLSWPACRPALPPPRHGRYTAAPARAPRCAPCTGPGHRPRPGNPGRAQTGCSNSPSFWAKTPSKYRSSRSGSSRYRLASRSTSMGSIWPPHRLQNRCRRAGPRSCPSACAHSSAPPAPSCADGPP